MDQVPWIETPLVKSAALSAAAGCHVFLKLENLQPSGSFKSRGIGNLMAARLRALPPAARSRVHFYSSSGGNAGLACVAAAATLGARASVVVPRSTPPLMVGRLRRAGAADVVRHGAAWHDADEHLRAAVVPAARARGEEPVYVPPFDAPEIWDGNAGITREAARQLGAAARPYPGPGPGPGPGPAPGRLDAVVCSVGGGGLLCGVVQGLDELGLRATRVLAVETRGADSLAQAVAARRLVTLPAITSRASSLGARRVCARALEYGLRDSVSTVVLSDADAAAAVRRFADEERLLVELACAVVPALCYGGRLQELVPGLGRDSVVVLVVCGGSNVSLDMLEVYAQPDS